MFWPRLFSFSAAVLAANAAQHTFAAQQSVSFTADQYDAGLFTPLGDLSALSTDVYTTLSHPLFPNYNVRIKKSDFCDGTVGCVMMNPRVETLHTETCLPAGHTRDTLTSKPGISSFTSLRAETTQPRTTSFSGRTEAQDVHHLSVSSWSLVRIDMASYSWSRRLITSDL